MTIYDYVELITDCENIVFTIFNLSGEGLMLVNTDDGDKTELIAEELLWSTCADYEIGGIDVWVKDGKAHMEFNVDVEEDD